MPKCTKTNSGLVMTKFSTNIEHTNQKENAKELETINKITKFDTSIHSFFYLSSMAKEVSNPQLGGPTTENSNVLHSLAAFLSMFT